MSVNVNENQPVNETHEKLLIIPNDHMYCRFSEKKINAGTAVVPDFDLCAVTDTGEQLHSDQSSMVAACASVDTHDVVCRRR